MRYKIENFPLLLKYAYPCIEFWFRNKNLAMQLKRSLAINFFKMVDKGLIEQLKLIAEGKKKPDKGLERKIEKLIPFAFSFLLNLGKKYRRKIIIDENVVRNYFCVLHRKIVKEEKKIFKKYKDVLELCDVKTGRVVEIRGKKGKVRVGNKSREVNLDFIEEPKIGDKVRIHFFYACEKI